ncbi:hypothetical protein DKX38_021465 [Salix brachista]|uniref:EamA domain-containing protein n=1 Tax=Salix brachista TaxID=2182728 RepID=A0A5N5K7W2_9ROSI|nr:hypothetical protein DKX38_021465 [Salix brachista]
MLSFKEFCTTKTLVALGLGQFLSLVITSTGFLSSELARRGINAPTSQSFLNYVFLAIVYGSIMLYRKQALKAKWYYYAILSLVDVEANFLGNCISPDYKANNQFVLSGLFTEASFILSDLPLVQYRVSSAANILFCYMVETILKRISELINGNKLLYLDVTDLTGTLVKAYQYTSITSVMLLDCWSIPSVMVLTWFFLSTKYRFKKIAGVVVCVSGLVMVVFSDVHAGDRSGGSSPHKGDALVIAGATLYAISNVSEEFLVKNADRVELMSLLGFFGAIISAIQIDNYRSIMEHNEVKSIQWSAGAALPFFGFAVAMFLFYSLVPILLKISGSTMLNLSLLTSDMWAVMIRIFAYHEKVDWAYYLAFAAVAAGLVVYSGGDKEEDRHCADVVDEDSERSKHFDEEACSGNRSKKTLLGSSKTGDSSKRDLASTSIGDGQGIENKNVGKDVWGK